MAGSISGLASGAPGGARHRVRIRSPDQLNAFIANGCRIVGVDASSAMISMCAERFRRHWQVADMRHLDLNRAFDGILAWDSFFHLPQADQRSMFPPLPRHAAAVPR